MNAEDAMGILIRSRFQGNVEMEKLSLFHVNRELKKGKKGSIDALLKIVDKQ